MATFNCAPRTCQAFVLRTEDSRPLKHGIHILMAEMARKFVIRRPLWELIVLGARKRAGEGQTQEAEAA